MEIAITNKGEIDSDKIDIKTTFTDFWFCIPEYQRSYVWENDQISELIEDIKYSCENTPNNEYFLGSLVLQKKKVIINSEKRSTYEEFDLLDGQQRLTTLFILLSVIRDSTTNEDLKKSCIDFLYQKENTFKNTPERLRIVYKIRDKVEDFIQSHIKKENDTIELADIEKAKKEKNVSVSNIASAILFIKKILNKWTQDFIDTFSHYLFNNVVLIYVAAEDLEDAFRLFTILNDRGIPLTNSDILKAWNLGSIENDREKEKKARLWEEIEGDFGRDEFERLLSFLRTILLKDKARENILKEFETKVYSAKPPLLKKGEETINFIEKNAKNYDKLYWYTDLPDSFTNEYKNLINIMDAGLPSSDWIPPLLYFYDKFDDANIILFLKKLDNKFSADWINQLTPTSRISNMNEILKAIESYTTSDELLTNTKIFSIDKKQLENNISGDIYGKRFTKYLLLKLEYLFTDHSTEIGSFKNLSVEHILPQTPRTDSQWVKDFNDDNFANSIHKIGNLILLGRRKNSQLNNKDFAAKKDLYFKNSIAAFPNSLRIMKYDKWTPATVYERQNELKNNLISHYISN